MKVLVLYDYPPSPGGLATQGDLLYQGLLELGVDVYAVNSESAQEKEWYYHWFKPDVVVGIGYWEHTPQLVLHPQRYGLQAVPWLVANGYIANYQEVLNELPLILVTSHWVKEMYIHDGINSDKIEVITDFPYLTIASDNVDKEQLDKPGKWDLKFIRNYMVIFGIYSSLFAVITILILFYLLKVKESVFQTSWFIESVLTELFIRFIIRTYKNFLQSKLGKYLFILSILGLILMLGLPYLPFAQDLGLVPLPMFNLGIMLLIVASYTITADILKVWFFKSIGVLNG